MTGACWLVITADDSCRWRKAARDACRASFPWPSTRTCSWRWTPCWVTPSWWALPRELWGSGRSVWLRSSPGRGWPVRSPSGSRSQPPPKRHSRSHRQAAGGTAEGSSIGLSILRLDAFDLGHPGRCAPGGTCLNPIWTDRGNGPAAAGPARYLQFLLADGIRDAATAQVTVTADQDSLRAAQDQHCSSSAAERRSRSAAAASPNNEVANNWSTSWNSRDHGRTAESVRTG